MERTIEPSRLGEMSDALILDVRRREDYAASGERIPGSTWKDPAQLEDWAESLPGDREIIVYCVRGGSVSNSVVDRLNGGGKRARYIAGGLEGFKQMGGQTEPK